MDNISLSPVVFYIGCIFIIILIITIIVLTYYLFKKNKYKSLTEATESVPSPHTPKYNPEYKRRKNSEELLAVYPRFDWHQTNQKSEPQMTSTTNIQGSINKSVNKSRENQAQKQVVLPTLILRQQMDQMVNELLNTNIKKRRTKNINDTIELIEFRKSKKNSTLANNLERSISTPDLDITEFYDVVPSKAIPVSEAQKSSEIEPQYALLRSSHSVIMDEDSGYMLPLSLKIAYVNANNIK